MTINELPPKVFLRDIIGSIKTTTTIPTYTPAKYEQQVVIYVDSVSSPTVQRLYIYSRDVKAWMYVALT